MEPGLKSILMVRETLRKAWRRKKSKRLRRELYLVEAFAFGALCGSWGRKFK